MIPLISSTFLSIINDDHTHSTSTTNEIPQVTHETFRSFLSTSTTFFSNLTNSLMEVNRGWYNRINSFFLIHPLLTDWLISLICLIGFGGFMILNIYFGHFLVVLSQYFWSFASIIWLFAVRSIDRGIRSTSTFKLEHTSLDGTAPVIAFPSPHRLEHSKVDDPTIGGRMIEEDGQGDEEEEEEQVEEEEEEEQVEEEEEKVLSAKQVGLKMEDLAWKYGLVHDLKGLQALKQREDLWEGEEGLKRSLDRLDGYGFIGEDKGAGALIPGGKEIGKKGKKGKKGKGRIQGYKLNNGDFVSWL